MRERVGRWLHEDAQAVRKDALALRSQVAFAIKFGVNPLLDGELEL